MYIQRKRSLEERNKKKRSEDDTLFIQDLNRKTGEFSVTSLSFSEQATTRKRKENTDV